MAEGYESFLEQMKQGYQQRTGIPVDSASDVGIRFAVLAEQLALLQQELETAQQQAFAQTATGQALEMHAAQRGLSRKQAVYASGTAVFSREEAAQADIPIPQGCFFDRADRQHPLCDRAGGGAQGRAAPVRRPSAARQRAAAATWPRAGSASW